MGKTEFYTYMPLEVSPAAHQIFTKGKQFSAVAAEAMDRICFVNTCICILIHYGM